MIARPGGTLRDTLRAIGPCGHLDTVRDLDDLADRLTVLLGAEPAADDGTQGALRALHHLAHYYVPAEHAETVLRAHHPPTAARANQLGYMPRLHQQQERGRPRTDVGLGERLADQHGADLAWCAALGGWLAWDGRRWRQSDDTAPHAAAKAVARRLARLAEIHRANGQDAEEVRREAEFAKQAQSVARVRAATDLARSEPGIATDAAEWDANPALLAVGNGTVELRREGAVLREHRRTDRLTRATTTPYKSDTPGGLWNAFLWRSLPDPDVRHYLHKLVGYSLLGANPERLLIVLIGPTSTGKSTFGETVMHVLGDHAADYNLAMFRGKREEGPRPDLVDALPRRLVFTTEASDRWRLHADEVKRLTGADTVRARTLHSRAFLARRPAFTPWLATNSAPIIRGADRALWRRLIVVPWVMAVARDAEDPRLGERIRAEEAPAVLAWAVAGWDAYCREGLGDVPAGCAQAAMNLREDLSLIDKWLAEHTERGPEYAATLEDLWGAYRWWCFDAGISDTERGNKIGFGKALTDRGFATGWSGSRDKRQRVRTRLRLRPGAEALLDL